MHQLPRAAGRGPELPLVVPPRAAAAAEHCSSAGRDASIGSGGRPRRCRRPASHRSADRIQRPAARRGRRASCEPARCTMSSRPVVTSGDSPRCTKIVRRCGRHLRQDEAQLGFAGQVQLRAVFVEVVVRQQVLPPPAVGHHDGEGSDRRRAVGLQERLGPVDVALVARGSTLSQKLADPLGLGRRGRPAESSTASTGRDRSETSAPSDVDASSRRRLLSCWPSRRNVPRCERLHRRMLSTQPAARNCGLDAPGSSKFADLALFTAIHHREHFADDRDRGRADQHHEDGRER